MTTFTSGEYVIYADGNIIGITQSALKFKFPGATMIDVPGRVGSYIAIMGGDQEASVEWEGLRDADKTNLALIHPGVTVAGDLAKIGMLPGTDVTSKAVLLRCHPVARGASLADDVYLFKAMNSLPFEFDSNPKSLETVKFRFVAMNDDTQATDRQLGVIGDYSNAVAPARTSTSPANLAENVSISVHPSIKFDNLMSAGSLVNAAGISPTVLLYNVTDKAFVSCTAAVTTVTNSNDTITLTPDAPLTNSKVYAIIASEGVYSKFGVAHAGSDSEFTTIAA